MKLSETDVLKMLASDPFLTASEILTDRLPKMDRKFVKAVKNLATILDEVKKEFPDAILYTSSGGLTLMLGNSHSDCNRRLPQQELIAVSCSGIISIGDGDF